MAENRKILFISAPIGSGHIRAAQSIQQALEKSTPGIETKLASVFDFFNPILGRSILSIYFTVLKYYPQAYGKAYGWGNSSTFALWGRQMVNSLLANHMQSFIESYQPAVIVCTHATPAGLIANLVQRNLINVPTIAVITDFSVHRLWAYPEIHRYYVAHEQMREFLENNSIPLSRSSVSGIPVMPQFTTCSERKLLLDKLGLREKLKTILIMGGGAGIMPLEKITSALCELAEPLQLIVIAGHNQEMYEKLERLKQSVNKSILLYGFTDNVHDLMNVADVLISKPGGVSSSEALAAHLPMIIYNPIPGVEEANTQYLTCSGAALRADNLSDVKELVSTLINDESRADELRSAISLIAKPMAAEHIAADILQIIGDR